MVRRPSPFQLDMTTHSHSNKTNAFSKAHLAILFHALSRQINKPTTLVVYGDALSVLGIPGGMPPYCDSVRSVQYFSLFEHDKELKEKADIKDAIKRVASKFNTDRSRLGLETPLDEDWMDDKSNLTLPWHLEYVFCRSKILGYVQFVFSAKR